MGIVREHQGIVFALATTLAMNSSITACGEAEPPRQDLGARKEAMVKAPNNGPLYAQQTAPAHASPAMLAMCSSQPNLPPLLRARFCPAHSTGAQTQTPSKNPLRLDGALATTNVPGAVGAQITAPASSGESVLYSFTPYLNGTNPYGNVCVGPGGNLFGTTYSGGSANAGTVYRVNNAGKAVLYNFTGGADGSSPSSSLLCDSAGNVYGTIGFNAGGAGFVFRVNGVGHLDVLYRFTGGDDGGYPAGGVLQDSAGNLYGTTIGGGSAGMGVVFKLDSSGHETVLHTFTGADGAYPQGDLIQDSAGNLYGTTSYGGPTSAQAGVVYKLDPKGNLTVLYSFTGGNDGGYPSVGVTRDSAGNLYGTTGGGSTGYGVVYKLDPMGNETVLYNFTGGADGGNPIAGVTLDAGGNLYGTANDGGSSVVYGGLGVVFKLDADGNETVLHTFTGKDGAYPSAGVTLDSAGNLYGATGSGGTANLGALFKLDTVGQYTVLFGFPTTDGANPVAGVIEDSAGNLYGTTTGGGTENAGLVFKVSTNGHETVLYTFTGGADGADPQGGLIQDAAGNFYGTTSLGGAAGAGVVFKLDAKGNETVLYSFTGGADGAHPQAGVTMDSAGDLYGTTSDGGSAGLGVVFKLDPMGHETVLHTFAGEPDGRNPRSGVTFDLAGNLYGTTFQGGVGCCDGWGVVYKLDPAGNYTILHSFVFAEGANPWGGLTLDAAGNLYGTTWSGGPRSGDYPGVVFKIDNGGNFSVLYTFTGFADGAGARSNMVFDSAGNLYGTTQAGGVSYYCPVESGATGCGVVFKLSPSGQQTVLYTFTNGADGSEPGTGLIRDAAGNLFGTGQFGGTGGGGVVYRLTPSGS
jgi:uncharacterized repeat protein (TIGR03803 family)